MYAAVLVKGHTVTAENSIAFKINGCLIESTNLPSPLERNGGKQIPLRRNVGLSTDKADSVYSGECL